MNLEELQILQQQEWAAIASLLLLTIAMAIVWGTVSRGYRYYAMLRNRLRFWEESMKKGRKYKRDMRLMCKIITHALESAEYDGEIDQRTKQFYYQQFGTKCGLVDLLPKKWGLVPISPNTKENIRNRLGPDVEQKLVKLRTRQKKIDPNLVYLQSLMKKSA